MQGLWTEERQTVLKAEPITIGAIVTAISTVIGIISTVITAAKFIFCYAVFLAIVFFFGINLIAFFKEFKLIDWLTRLLERSQGCTPYPLSGQ